MSNVYGLRQDDAYQALVQVDDDSEIAYDASVAIRATALCGQAFGVEYSPARLSWGTPLRKKDSDFQSMLSPFLIFSKKALDALAPFLQGSGELLPVEAPVDGMTGFHVTRVLEDAVDLEASKFKVYPQATVFNKIVLLESRVEGVDLFRLKEEPATVFVSERFKEAVESSKLKGFDFGDVISQSSKGT
ncbi:imm11 family protein [Burkholderia pyrrocinia]|uniref:imm11 family protein n=1 Tax=Burkholderia pyrrocinia TaxID=60550 RepID=UPI002AB1B821|nr:DUF1629 domain-containing protein [Burkholderia pyrrocinia]